MTASFEHPVSSARTWALVDLFSGCGGVSEGVLSTGRYRHVYAADNDRWANATYARNLGHEPVTLDLAELNCDGRRRDWARAIRSAVGPSPLLLTGGPPCQGFSSHVKVHGDRHGRNNLFSLFGKLALALRPEVVMIENVADLVAERSWPVFADVRAELCAAGYVVRARILNMAQLGVPQERFRTVVLASLTGVPTYPAPAVLDPSSYSTVKEWIGDLPPITSGETNLIDPMHETSRHRSTTLKILRQVPHDGGSRPRGVGPTCLDRTYKSHGGYTDVYGRLAWSETAPTITARCRTPSCGRFVHPEQDRGLTAREAGLLQTFPVSWYFEGPFDDRYKQIGNAVPPLAARHFGAHIAADMPNVDCEVGLYEVGERPIGSSFSVLIPGIRKRGGFMRSEATAS